MLLFSVLIITFSEQIHFWSIISREKQIYYSPYGNNTTPKALNLNNNCSYIRGHYDN